MSDRTREAIRAKLAEHGIYWAYTVPDEKIRDTLIGFAVEAYMLERWESFGVWSGYLDEAARELLVERLFVA